jgi:hypothetical protein
LSALDPVQIAALDFARDKKKPGIPKGYKFAKPRTSQRGKQMDAFIEMAAAHKGPECLIWPFHRDDLGRAKTQRRQGGRIIIISRVVCEHVLGPPPFPSAWALHSCGKSHDGCVSGAHLYWGTPKENSADSIRHGTMIRGSKHQFSKLTEDQVRKIKSGILTYTELKSFGVTLQNIDYILQGKIWKHVNP